MNIHEYQAKEIFRKYEIPTLQGVLIDKNTDYSSACNSLGGDLWVVKAQVHAGGRGKGGGIVVCKSQDEVSSACDKLLGSRLITPQTEKEGVLVRKIYLEEGCEISNELYLGLVLDRESEKFVFMISTEGGVEIEEVAKDTPDKILKLYIESDGTIDLKEAERISIKLGLTENQISVMIKLMQSLSKMAYDLDCSLVEINPLVVTKSNDIIALDAKVNFDDSALFRHPDVFELRDSSEDNPLEVRAISAGLNYIKLDGEIGCMVNGAGLAMATMDIIKLHGGEPANFLDVGGGATPDQISEGFRVILSDPEVKAIFVNIFGGIMRCDFVAEGIISAAQDVDLTIPLIVRLSGTNSELGRDLLNQSGLQLTAVSDMDEGARVAISSLEGSE
ncbi:MAG: succinate--CoA ligase subunit beta [Marine Group III euryarchaeote CG-Bathy1]|uniref:Succinate--CoA ligase [ADP-forming] subunit beta n=1 Tax=Marine Group III euryarchaeote CG-Bathy1 TaxID=1889001 RepID=A0A1J5TFL1_9ARCH|nr:MAG: succinate--CoA ligase subunit beta [Marine Group III euryarchaeote CG-Bathy1]